MKLLKQTNSFTNKTHNVKPRNDKLLNHLREFNRENKYISHQWKLNVKSQNNKLPNYSNEFNKENKFITHEKCNVKSQKDKLPNHSIELNKENKFISYPRKTPNRIAKRQVA